MTDLLEKALLAVRKLPRRSQDEIAKAMLRLAEGSAPLEPVDAAHRAAVLEGLGQVKRGDIATDAEVKAAFRRFNS